MVYLYSIFKLTSAIHDYLLQQDVFKVWFDYTCLYFNRKSDSNNNNNYCNLDDIYSIK